jgi:crotonobetainyl-CoA:carnitine CoA-transferase CaiB-like acyl-CoA transferase
MVQEVEDGMLGPVLHPGVIPRVDGVPNAPRSTGPAVGADNDAVLGELLGYDAARIAALREGGVL